MKCPKCGYLRFEHVERCRYCGYDFSLSPAAAPAADPDLPIRPRAAAPSTADLSMLDLKLAAAAESDLPFADDLRTDAEPLFTRPSRPRAPLAVRRATPEVPRLRSQPLTPSLDFSLDPAEAPAAERVTSATVAGRSEAAEPSLAAAATATPFARLAAAAIDLVILAAVDAVVIYFTLRICGVSMAEIGVVPKGPLVAFMLVQNLGYLVAFTAGGQTLGKMAVGIRVVQADSEQPLDLSHAALRTLVWIALAVPGGLGFLTTIPGSEHRGLHDRFAGTRVVRASSF
jgi:uncharacterized RDD family membrane protein YckC